MSNLYIVGTPIGNLGDITSRAIEVLSSVDFVVAEDTRVGKKLLSAYGISKPVISFHAHSTNESLKKIVNEIEEGKNVAYISDAGTPGISDPGGELVRAVRQRDKEVKIVAVPGPSSLTAALSISGIGETPFIFYGFAPHKKGRQTFFKEISGEDKAVVFFESTHRLIKTLDSLIQECGDREMVIVKEITKVFEDVIHGLPKEIKAIFLGDIKKQKGEFVVILYPRKKDKKEV